MIKTLAGSLRQHKKGSILTVCLSILEAGFEIVIPLCMSGLIDYGVERGAMERVWQFGAAAVPAGRRDGLRPDLRQGLRRVRRQPAAGYV